MQDAAAREAIVRVCRRLYAAGLIAGQDGNVSVRCGDGRILVTPSGLSKVDVEADDLVVLDSEGRHVAGDRRASSEVAVHLRIYARRADVGAVVHAHPPTATGFAVAGEGLAADVLPELILLMGSVPLVPYATPGTTALADQFEPFLAGHEAFLMANHGATTVGPTVAIAHQRMESVEHAAKILLTARLLGRTDRLSREQVRALEERRDGDRIR
ncbi:MAG TPA: class II aldolase/adducin family protein [Gemmatimonadaceae bacterium]|jgi:L-fuculose-phosphate aldolase|nr:class II aldolase/adducin family protein [Gemmatimonadaceae bacterium]